MSYEFDLVVVGGGAAGLTAAGISAVLGAKTALIEAHKLGGDCTWYGCVPSKSLLRAAKVAHQTKTAGRYGLAPADPDHDFSRVMERVHSIRNHIYAEVDAPPNLEKLGVEVMPGRARFLDPHALEVQSDEGVRRLTSRYFIVATGSSPRIPSLQTDGSIPVLTNETLFELQSRPRRLLVLGAGPIGIEMAQAFQRLGSCVTVVSHSDGILGRDDRELAGMLLERLRGEGIRFLLGAELARIENSAAWTASGEPIEADAVLAAIGRKPNLESLQLDRAGVRTDEKGIAIDRRCRSSAKHIYAAGDVAGRFLFTHMAEHMAKVAVTNAILRLPARIDDRHVVWTTFTDPELAHVGATEGDLKRSGTGYTAHRFPFEQLDRAIADSEVTGMVKALANRRGRILGASILGAHAGEMIGEYALAMRNRITLGRLSATIHPYPTYGLGNRRAADQFMVAKLTPRLVRWLKRLFGLRGSLRGVTALSQAKRSV
ncbi:MAG: FAD-dependent oxidoreductase [Bryobacteraceae bacterium]|nr:FAD-dependent oxidoreductase [Bryobacteraceae bacterium]